MTYQRQSKELKTRPGFFQLTTPFNGQDVIVEYRVVRPPGKQVLIQLVSVFEVGDRREITNKLTMGGRVNLIKMVERDRRKPE